MTKCESRINGMINNEGFKGQCTFASFLASLFEILLQFVSFVLIRS
jgi:hypothetical protein